MIITCFLILSCMFVKKNGEKIRFDYYHKYFLPPRCQLRDAIKYYSDEAVPFIEYRGNHSIFGK